MDTDDSKDLSLVEWLAMWECKLDQPKILWTYKWLDFNSKNEHDEKDSAERDDIADWICGKYTTLDEDDYLAMLSKVKRSGRVNYENFWDSLPKEIPGDI